MVINLQIYIALLFWYYFAFIRIVFKKIHVGIKKTWFLSCLMILFQVVTATTVKNFIFWIGCTANTILLCLTNIK
jgi:hypothetical protein